MIRNQFANLFDLFILFVVCTSFVSIFLLVLNQFDPYYAVPAAIILTGISVKLLHLKIYPGLRGIPVSLILILLAGLIFRFAPYLTVYGGQDQGVYVNMSATYETNGSTFIVDEVRKSAVEAGLQEWYDAKNQSRRENVEEGKYEGEHLPGIYIKRLKDSKYVYQFYPLHPLWMALAGKFFGDQNRIYSLVFFSLLSIISFYLLASIIPGGNKFSSVLIGVLLAINPLHAFFSKFPVTEMVALCFSSLGFYYLLKYRRSTRIDETDIFYLCLSAGLFGCMFFTRISGFLYIPFFYFLFVVTIIFEKDATVRNGLSLYFMSIFCLYALSVAYGLLYSYPYSHDIYANLLGKLFQSAWQQKLRWIVAGACGTLAVLFFLRKHVARLFESASILRIIRKNANIIWSVVLGCVIVLAGYKAYQLGFTDQYAGGRIVPGGEGWASVRSSNMFVVMMYLSPVGLSIFLYGIIKFFPNRKDILWGGFVIFLAMFWYLFTVRRIITEYHYYYARYLLSEVVPYTLLAVCIILGHLFQKKRLGKVISISLSAIIAGFFLYFSSYQFLGKSGDGSYASLKEIDESMREDDLLIICGIDPPFQWIIRTPLSFYYDLNTCSVKSVTDLQTLNGKRFLSKFGDVFMLSRDRLGFRFLTPIKEITYTQGDFVKSKSIPKKYQYTSERLRFYEIDKSALSANRIYPLEKKADLVNFYDGLWTNGNGIIDNLEHQLKPNDKYITLHTCGLNPFIHSLKWPKPKLYINGVEQTFFAKSRDTFTYRINDDIDVIRKIRIASETFVPKAHGINEDNRELGLDINFISTSDKRIDNVFNPRQMQRDLHNFYDGYFTNGKGTIRNINYEVKPTDKYVIINTMGWNPFIYHGKWQTPELYINGIKQSFYSKSRSSYVFRMSDGIRLIRNIQIVSETFVPKEEGINQDTRRLGVDVGSIVIR